MCWKAPLRVSVFAFDADNPGFGPKIRFTPTGPLSGAQGNTAATVHHDVSRQPAARHNAGGACGSK